jgi:hypothetical protein
MSIVKMVRAVIPIVQIRMILMNFMINYSEGMTKQKENWKIRRNLQRRKKKHLLALIISEQS